jgi:hypothetical protein
MLKMSLGTPFPRGSGHDQQQMGGGGYVEPLLQLDKVTNWAIAQHQFQQAQAQEGGEGSTPPAAPATNLSGGGLTAKTTNSNSSGGHASASALGIQTYN